MFRKTALLTGLALVLMAVPAEAKTPRPIVYTVVIDGLDGDRVDAGRAPFISSLLAGQDARATYYRESRSIMVAETNPNHTAMITGAYADRSGIPGNSFAVYSKLANEDTCRRKRASGPDQAAQHDQRRERRLHRGRDGVRRRAPPGQPRRPGHRRGVRQAQARAGCSRAARGSREHDADYLWAPCADDKGKDDDDYCAKVPLDEDNGYAKDDATPMNAVLDTMRRGVGKAKRRPDFTFVNLQQVDATGHKKGTGTRRVRPRDRRGRRADQAAGGRAQGPRRVEPHHAGPAVRPLDGHHAAPDQPDQAPQRRPGRALQGLRDRAQRQRRHGLPGQPQEQAPSRLLKRMRAAALRTPGVVEALYRRPNPADGGRRHTLRAVHPGWHLDGPRTGDLFVTDRSGGAFAEPDNELVGNHGGPQTRDNFFAVIGGGAQVRQAAARRPRGPLFDDTLVNPRQAENVDPAPTVMGLLGLAPPGDSRGRFLSESTNLAALPGAGAPAVRATLKVVCRPARKARVPLRVRMGPAGWSSALPGRREGQGAGHEHPSP